MAMGIAEAARLYERIDALESKVAELCARLEKQENRAKPGPKPKVEDAAKAAE